MTDVRGQFDVVPTNPPKRRHHLTLTFGADSLDDLRHALDQLLMDLRETGNRSVTGGCSWGGHFDHVVDPEQTHERYFEQVEAWKAARAAEAKP